MAATMTTMRTSTPRTLGQIKALRKLAQADPKKEHPLKKHRTALLVGGGAAALLGAGALGAHALSSGGDHSDITETEHQQRLNTGLEHAKHLPHNEKI